MADISECAQQSVRLVQRGALSSASSCFFAPQGEFSGDPSRTFDSHVSNRCDMMRDSHDGVMFGTSFS